MSAMNPYRTLRQSASDEFIINKSRFIGYAAPCETEAEALAFLQSIRTKHKDATHNCYAYIIGQNAGIMRYSDDGEPGGTAGLPMMEVLKHQGVVNCCCVVTRYFGGVLLGAGRIKKEDSIDFAAGITMHKKLGDYVKAGESICTFYADDESLFAAAEEMYRGGLIIRAEKPTVPPLIYARVTADGVERF